MPTPSRRRFIGTSATAAAAFSILPSRAAESTAAPIKLGLIGCGWWGMLDAKSALKAGSVEVVGVCDVDREHLDRAAAELESVQGTRPKAFKQFEDLLDLPDLQAVVIATPPQWHALPFIAACERKLDIYCEKPLAYDVREGRAMVEAARKSGNIVQIGFQRRRAEGIRQAREFIREGKAGPIVSAEAQIHYRADTPDPTPVDPPESLDWDLWCGPAPLLPYSKAIGHMSWRLEKTTGHGHLVDWGIHLIDAARWVLGSDAPRSVTSAGGLYQLAGKITTPDILTSHFEFEEAPLTWRHRIWGAQDVHPDTSNGVFFYGEEATVFCTDNRWSVTPRRRGAEPEVHETQGDSLALHMAEFLESIRTREAPETGVEEAHLSTTAVKLAMISHEIGRRVRWDPDTEQIVGDAEAGKLLWRDYRAPWSHPFAG